MSKNDNEDLVARAQARAAIDSYLTNNPGNHPVGAVAEACGVSRGTAGQILRHLAESGMAFGPIKEGTTKLYRHREQEDPPNTALTEVPPETPRRMPSRRKVENSGGLEIQLGDTVFLVGRNPVTGRLRIMLEDL